VSGETFKAPTGTHDVLPPGSARWLALEARFAEIVGNAGYGQLRTPLFEDVGVFHRVGEATDVVRKEMYDFEDKGGRRVALRPEGTASVVRAFVQHRPTAVPWKVWYSAPMFRYERPQAGRYRQHQQLGLEALGSDDADLDVEVIALQATFYAELGLRRVLLLINSLGDANCKPQYLETLGAYLQERHDDLCDEHRQRAAENPLRVLDCKRQTCIEATRNAPRMVEHLCGPCHDHFERVQAGLRSLGIAFAIETRLVRGLDYYTRTTFEFQASALDGAQNAVGGGGRYNGLVESLGGPATPGIGFGSGIERVLLACDAEGVFDAPSASVDVFVVDVTDGANARDLTAELRAAGIAADRSFDGRSMKSQMKAADRSGARVALLVGEDEVAKSVVTIRHLRGDAPQEEAARAEVIKRVRSLLS
jgi:histidyl-tRNA synthetase